MLESELMNYTKMRHRLTFHCDQDWMKGTHVKGVVLGRHVFFAMPAQNVPRWLFRHELEHCYQIEREGVFKFYFKYLWYSLRYGYERNPYERDAHDMQSLPLSLSEEALLCKLREG